MSVPLLLELLDEAYAGASWHGPTLRGSVRGLGLDVASWRTSPQARKIGEVALRAHYWKYLVVRRSTGEQRGGCAPKGSDWFVRPSNDSAEPSTDGAKHLDDDHPRPRSCVESPDPADLDYT